MRFRCRKHWLERIWGIINSILRSHAFWARITLWGVLLEALWTHYRFFLKVVRFLKLVFHHHCHMLSLFDSVFSPKDLQFVLAMRPLSFTDNAFGPPINCGWFYQNTWDWWLIKCELFLSNRCMIVEWSAKCDCLGKGS